MSMFKDENQDGIPDMFQGDVIGNLIKAATTTVIVDGKPVSGLGEMTPEQRAKVEQALAKLKEKGIITQVPDLSKQEQVPAWEDAEIRPSEPIIPQPSAIQEDNGVSRLLIPILVGVIICGVGLAVFFFFGPGF